MDSFKYNLTNVEEVKSIFTTASDSQISTTTTTAAETCTSIPNAQGSMFSPLAAPFQSRVTDEYCSVAPPESRNADTDIDDLLRNLRINNSDSVFTDAAEQNGSSYFSTGTRAESIASAPANIWSDTTAASKGSDMYDSFDFFLKTLSSANTYASMLSREQLSVLQSIRPSLLYEFLQEVARIRTDKRMQRALPHECAFCKNNGENEENYTSHALKDWRGRVQCPVLRAFRCPRCGATGDRAHTIKYCPANDAGLDRNNTLLRRRLASANSFTFCEGSRFSDYMAPSTPTQSPSVSSTVNTSAFWSHFGGN